jgi:hypothetical protein
LRRSNKKTYDFFKKIRRRLENDDKERPNFVSWAQTYDGGHRWDIMTRGVNDTLLPIYLIRTVFDKMGMGKKISVNLFDMGKGNNFISLSK